MIFKKTKKFRDALTENGYLVSDRNKNGEFLLLKRVISKFDIFFDIGFHEGVISNYVRKISDQIKIYAFDLNEIKPQIKKICLKKNINFSPHCILNKNKKINFYFYPQRPELSSLVRRKDYNPNISNNYKIKKKDGKKIISVISENNLDKKLNYFIKIDTDGFEADIIFSLKNYFNELSLSGYFEYGSGWKNYKKKLKDVYYLLKKIILKFIDFVKVV